MLFNSYIFILLFLPIVVIGYFLINRFEKYKLANLFLIGMSLWFYGYYNPKYLLVIGTSVLANYGVSRWLNRIEKERLKKTVLAVGITGNIASIFYFKYFNFFLSNLNAVFSQSFELKHIVLPLGISFFTFQQVSYLIDTYRGQTKDYGFIEYALFVVYFPQLVAGPIVLHKEIIPQFRDTVKRKADYKNLSNGLYIFALGLFKKVLIADTFGKAVTWGFTNIDYLGSWDALIVSLCYTFQLYFDFSGYCDMAIGMSSMLNIRLPQNFNSPYKATSIVDFWSRWHMSLTRFLREYVYFPLGGSKKGKARTYINIMLVFLISGVWHGANWTFVLWGVLHGILNCLTRACKTVWEKLHMVIRWLLTFMTVNVLWVIFRAENIEQAFFFIKKMFTAGTQPINAGLSAQFELEELKLVFTKIPGLSACVGGVAGFYMWLFLGAAFFIVLTLKNSYEIQFKPTIKRGLLTVALLVWSIMSLAGFSEFLYFGF